MRYFIKNMVVQQVFERLNYLPVHFSLGEVETTHSLENTEMEQLREKHTTRLNESFRNSQLPTRMQE